MESEIVEVESDNCSTEQESANILEIFWSLSSLEEVEQLRAAKQLLISLQEAQASCDEGVCSEVQYSLKRLVRGLASNRKGARQGFYITLTELLALFPVIPVTQLFDLIQTHLEPAASDKSSEERGAYFGKVFALLSLVKSGRLVGKEDVVNVTEQLLSCWHCKSYLREFCSVSIGQLIDMCHASGKDDVIEAHVIPLLGFDKGWEECNPEQLYILLHLSSVYSKEKWLKVLMKEKFGSKNVCSHQNFDKLSKVLLESTSSHPRLHAVWSLILEPVRVNGQLASFWKCVVDDTLFLSSHERKYLGFKLLESLLSSLSPAELPIVFSANLLSCLLNNSFSKQNYLNAAAKHLLSKISALIDDSTDNDLLVSLYIHLQINTSNKFDRLTGSKVTDEVLAKLMPTGVEQLVDRLQTSFCDPDTCHNIHGTSDKEALSPHSVRLWCLDQIIYLLRHTKIIKSDFWILKAIQYLIVNALFNTSTTDTITLQEPISLPKGPLGASIHQATLQRLSSALADVSTLNLMSAASQIGKKDGDKDDSSKVGGNEVGDGSAQGSAGSKRDGRWSRPPPGVMENGRYFLTAVVEFVDKMKRRGELDLVDEFTDDAAGAWDIVVQTIASLSDKDVLSVEERAFLLLFSSLGLRLLCSKEERTATSQIIQEVNVCFSEMNQLNSKKKTRTPRKSRTKEGPGWMSVLTDVLLGFLSQPSQLWRNIVEQVFKQLTHCVTESSLKLILEVLEPKQTKDDLMEVKDEASDGTEEESIDGTGDEEQISDSDTSMSNNLGETGGDIDPAFRADVRRALGAAAVDSDAESESSLDDDAMMAVDDALAEVFRTRFALKHQKKIQRDEDKSVVHFKLRVLGLLEAFIRKQSTNPLVLDLVLPLYKIVHASQSSQDHAPLVEKAANIFKTRLCHMKEYPKTDVDASHLHGYLHQLVDHMSKANSTSSPLLTQGFLFLIRVLRGNSALPLVSPIKTRSARKRKHQVNDVVNNEVKGHGLLNVPEVTVWLSSALHDFTTTKNSSISPTFFSTYIQRYPSLASHLAPKLIQDLPSAANHFKKTQVYEFLSTMRTQCDTYGNKESGSPFDQLTSEDLQAIEDMAPKSKKMRSKRRK